MILFTRCCSLPFRIVVMISSVYISCVLAEPLFLFAANEPHSRDPKIIAVPTLVRKVLNLSPAYKITIFTFPEWSPGSPKTLLNKLVMGVKWSAVCAIKDLCILVTDFIALSIVIAQMSKAFWAYRPTLGRTYDSLLALLADGVAFTVNGIKLFKFVIALEIPTANWISSGVIRVFFLANLNFMLRPFHKIVVITVASRIVNWQLVFYESLMRISYIL